MRTYTLWKHEDDPVEMECLCNSNTQTLLVDRVHRKVFCVDCRYEMPYNVKYESATDEELHQQFLEQ